MSSTKKKYTVNFIRICIANTLLYISLFLTIPSFIEETSKVPQENQLVSYFLFILGFVTIGPFQSFLTDQVRRKKLCLISYLGLTGSYLAINYIGNLEQALVLLFLQGVVFNLASITTITLAIDSTDSSKRNQGNLSIAYCSQLGLIIGIITGYIIYRQTSLTLLTYFSAGSSLIGYLLVGKASTPFRAPIGAPFLSLDRFFLPKSTRVFLNILFYSIALGVTLPNIQESINNSIEIDSLLLYFITFFMATILWLTITHYSKKIRRFYRFIAVNILAFISLLIASKLNIEQDIIGLAFLFSLYIACLMHIKLIFLVMIVDLSKHCERITANSSYLLATVCGLFIGILITTNEQLSLDQAVRFGAIFIGIGLFIYLLFSHPFYRKNRFRDY